ncbi:MAG: hypothetical protein L0228_13170 [Planctomycetes bacterium]|nr:hypothetical protein [Planctomycetota bacterium]
MNEQTVSRIKRDFQDWSGGFAPESTYQIIVYIDYALPCDNGAREEDVGDILTNWMRFKDANQDSFLADYLQPPIAD